MLILKNPNCKAQAAMKRIGSVMKLSKKIFKKKKQYENYMFFKKLVLKHISIFFPSLLVRFVQFKEGKSIEVKV